jgi:methylase of polypeptide subunit release factors
MLDRKYAAQTENIPQRKACPFRLERCGDLTPLRQTLSEAGYSQEALAETVKVRDSGGQLDLCAVLRRTAAPTPYHTLVRLFLLGQALPLDAVRAVFAPMDLDQLTAVGLLKLTDAGVRSEARLIPVEDLFVVHDFGSEITGQPLPPGHVLGVGAASITLANLTVRRRVESVLDLGTGSGIQALLAARHAARVIATDTNRRALNFAGLNARLNGVANIELREGDLYGPVEGHQFDLIIANPPFVISPESRYAYRDSELPGDAISERVIRGASMLLSDGGYGIVLCNWHHQRDQEWAERPRQWVTASGCDAWILCFETEDPLTYAANWLRPTEGRDQLDYGQLLDQWLQYYEQLGIGCISAGAVILRRRSGRPNWVRADTVPSGRRVGSCGEQIERIFAAEDFLLTLDTEHELLSRALVLVPDHRMDHTLQAENGGWSVKSAHLKLTQGFEFTGEVDRLVSAVLAGCDGQHSLRELTADLARGLGMDFEAIAPACIGIVRKLMQSGFLRVSGSRGTQERAG